MTKEAKELIAQYLEHFYGFEIEESVRNEEARACAINDLNNTIKALQDVQQWYSLTDASWGIAQVEIEKYQQLLNEIQNEQ